MNKKTVFYFFLVVIYLLFQGQLLKGFDEHIVTPYLKEITGSITLLLLFILLVALTIYQLCYLGKKKQQVSFPLMFAAVFLLCIYLYYRLFTDHYVYHFSSFAPFLKFSDYILILLGGIIILGVVERFSAKGKPDYKNKAFLIDAPILKATEDKFDRNSFAKLLSEKIQSELKNENSGALAIGVNGLWGTGKTSFTNLIKADFDITNRIIIDFNPWRSLTPAKIIEDFFELITDELQKYDAELSADIEAYAKTLTEIDDNVVTKGIKSLSGLLFDSKSKQEYYDKINHSIAKTGKQIIIFIDDLDRLDLKEIVEVLRLIRNTANFNKLVYVVAYDRNYVLEAIKTFNPNEYELFLEKIFQFEFNLPELNPVVIRDSIEAALTAGLTAGKHTTIKNAIGFVGNSGRNLTNRIIRTQRDVVRFSNSFLFELVKVENEVNLIDFYLLQLIKLKYSKIYDQLVKYKTVFFINDKSRMRLRTSSERNSEFTSFDEMWNRMHPKDKEEKDSPILYDFIKANVKTEFDYDALKEIFEALLTEKDFREGSASRDYKSFVNYANFESYFTISQDAGGLSAAEFETDRLGDYVLYQAKIDQWLGEDRVQVIQDRLQSIVDFETKSEWENHLKILIHIGKEISKSNPYGVNYRQIVDTINYPKKRDGFIKFFDNEQAYRNYFIEFFEQAPEPYVFESHILNVGLSGLVDFPLGREEVQDQLYKYFEDYCAAHAEISINFRALYPLITEYHNIINVAYPIQARAKALFKSHFLANLEAKDLASFIELYDITSKYYNFNMPWIIEFYPTLNEFIAYVDRAPKIDKTDEHYLEFKRFYDAMVASGRNAIEYDFEHLTKINLNLQRYE